MADRPIPCAVLKAAVGAVCGYESYAIGASWGCRIMRRLARPPTVSEWCGRQRPCLRALIVGVIVGGLFLHLVPAALSWSWALISRCVEKETERKGYV